MRQLFKRKVPKGRPTVGDVATWAVLGVCGFGKPLAHVVLRSNQQTIQLPNLELVRDTDLEFLELAKRQYEEEQQRWNQIDEKSRTLLTVAGLLVPLTVGLLPAGSSRGFAVFGLALLLLTTYTILQIFGVSTVRFPSLDNELIAAPKDAQFRLLIGDFLNSAAWNHCANNFRVDLYRAAHRLFLASLAFIVLSGVRSMNASFSGVIQALRTMVGH